MVAHYNPQMVQSVTDDEDVTLSPGPPSPQTEPFHEIKPIALCRPQVVRYHNTLSVLAWVALSSRVNKDSSFTRFTIMTDDEPPSDRSPLKRKRERNHPAQSVERNRWSQHQRHSDRSSSEAPAARYAGCDDLASSSFSQEALTNSDESLDDKESVLSEAVATADLKSRKSERNAPLTLPAACKPELQRLSKIKLSATTGVKSSDASSNNTYACSYCGKRKTSTSTGQDGRIRIRCDCGGKHRDGAERMHAMYAFPLYVYWVTYCLLQVDSSLAEKVLKRHRKWEWRVLDGPP